jgi:hypothetical protein
MTSLKRLAVVFVALLAVVSLGAGIPLNEPRTAFGASTTFVFTGGEQTYVVPLGVTLLQIEAHGANGGLACRTDIPQNARGHKLTALVPVTPGATLYVQVGGIGGNASGSTPGAGGFNGGGTGGTTTKVGQPGVATAGGGGGGASDVRTSPRAAVNSLQTRLITAGGGGGRGGCAVSTAFAGFGGGDGGHPQGQNGAGGFDPFSSPLGGGGRGGTQAGGGAGGHADTIRQGVPGNPGSQGQGGSGGGGTSISSGAGGGGGFFGGGGGGSGAIDNAGTTDALGGGGGGGSSGFLAGGTLLQAVVSGDAPSVTIHTLAPPTLSKSFQPASAAVNGVSDLTFVVTNPNVPNLIVPSPDLHAISFTDQLPDGVVVDTGVPTNVSGTCRGTITAVAGTRDILLQNEQLNGGVTCQFTIAVRALTPGTKTNVTSAITAGESGPGGTATAVLAVGAVPPPVDTPTSASPTPGATSTVLGQPAATPVVLQPVQPIPQVFQNPAALGVVQAGNRATPTPARQAVAPAMPVPQAPLAIQPPRTGDGGLK